MKLRIDYLNKLKEPRHIFTSLEENADDFDKLGYELSSILLQWATDIRIYNLTNKLCKK